MDSVAARPSAKPSVGLRSFTKFASDIKLAHSIFALPFASSSFFFTEADLLAALSPKNVALLLVCMVSARSFAMGMNRFLDRGIDALNPRPLGRQIPKGELSPAAG